MIFSVNAKAVSEEFETFEVGGERSSKQSARKKATAAQRGEGAQINLT